jgi:hypothetical protein
MVSGPGSDGGLSRKRWHLSWFGKRKRRGNAASAKDPAAGPVGPDTCLRRADGRKLLAQPDIGVMAATVTVAIRR